MIFTTKTIDTVLSPTDIVFYNADNYNSWWYLSNYKSSKGELQFYKICTINRGFIDIQMISTLHKMLIPQFTVHSSFI